MAELNIATYNVRGLADSKKRREVFYYLHKKLYDIILLQETHRAKSMFKRWGSEWGGRMYCSHGESIARGTAILKRKTPITVLHEIMDSNGRFVILKCKVNGNELMNEIQPESLMVVGLCIKRLGKNQSSGLPLN